MEVKIHINDPILRCYLNGLFKRREDGSYTVSTDTMTGVVICALVQHSEFPEISERDSKDTVTLHLPKSRINDSHRDKPLHLSTDSEVKINKVLRREFDLNLDASCTESRQCGGKLVDAIDMFIVSNKMDDLFGGSVETLKKRFYRSEVKNLENMREILHNQVKMRVRRRRKKMKNAICW